MSEPTPESTMRDLLKLAKSFQEVADFIGNSWWRRTIINLVGGGDRGIRFEKHRD